MRLSQGLYFVTLFNQNDRKMTLSVNKDGAFSPFSN